jgi:hypothetical protein
MNRRTLLRTLCGAAVALLTGCLSPTLPLPPPDEPTQIEPAGTTGMWEIQGNCIPGANVLIRNERTGVITGVQDRGDTGRYVVEIAAVECDPATVFELKDDIVTAGTSFLVREVINGVPQRECGDAGP